MGLFPSLLPTFHVNDLFWMLKYYTSMNSLEIEDNHQNLCNLIVIFINILNGGFKK